MQGQIAVMTEPGQLTYQDYPVPDPAPGALIVRILRSNVCGSEIHIWCGHHPTKRKGGLGHETVGVIEKLGAGVTTDHAGNVIKEGDRIVATYFIHCRRCPPCQRAQVHLCENAYTYWSRQPEDAPHFHATFATHWYVHPEQIFYKVPDSVSDRAAASANCAQSQVYFGLELAKTRLGDRVVIQGAGGLGLNAAAIAREMGAEVIVIDAVSARLAEARKFGAHHVVDMGAYPTVEDRVAVVTELTRGGADICLEVAGVHEAYPEAIRLLRPGGTLVAMGIVNPGKTVPFDPGFAVRRGLTTIATVRYPGYYLNKSLDFLAHYGARYPFDALLDRDYELSQVRLALDDSAARRVIRASIVM